VVVVSGSVVAPPHAARKRQTSERKKEDRMGRHGTPIGASLQGFGEGPEHARISRSIEVLRCARPNRRSPFAHG
jgi:hypothetical protein